MRLKNTIPLILAVAHFAIVYLGHRINLGAIGYSDDIVQAYRWQLRFYIRRRCRGSWSRMTEAWGVYDRLDRSELNKLGIT